MSPPNVPKPDNPKVRRSRKQKGRRGPPGHFQGSRLSFLTSKIEEYSALKKGSRCGFWHKLYSDWWERYPWKLDDKEEPPEDDPVKMTRLRSVAPGESALKTTVEQELTGRLRQWFINHGTAKAASNNSWLPLLRRLHQLQNPRPRRRTTVQQFMLDHPDIVNAAFVSQHADGRGLSAPQKMNARHDLAKTLLSTRYSHLTSALETKAISKHDAELEEWELILDGVSSAENVTRARDSLFEAVHPLIEAIGAYAGCYISLIAGSPKKDDSKGFFTALHWWPGDRGLTQNWAKWDEGAFGSGVAGPFLEYARETDRLSRGTEDEASQALPPTPSHSVLAINSVQPTDDPPTRVQSPTTTTTVRQANYRPLPTKKPVPARGTKKRKHDSKTRPIRYFEDSGGEGDDPGGLSGDGSSSGDSVSSNAPAHAKRQRTSRIVTRASTRTPARDVNIPSNPPSPSLVVGTQPLPIPGAGTPDPATLSASIDSPDVSANTADMDCSYNGDVPRASGELPTDSQNTTTIETAATCDTSTPSTPPATHSVITTDIGTELVVGTRSAITSSVTATTSSPPPLLALSNDFDVGTVPAFLLSHGTGKRKVNIFHYLNEAKDPRFRQVLLQYIHFEVNDRSQRAGSLPTAVRPVEISRWTGGARPADLPAYAKGKRTFSDFVDSIVAWWASIQPPWRSFKRGVVSREVRGDWDVIRAPRINGLLNVVVLVYWWGRILEEQKPEDGVRADYEQFADDVAWVISNLSA